MDNLNKIEIAARNKANYLKAKEAFNNKRVDECILFYAAEAEALGCDWYAKWKVLTKISSIEPKEGAVQAMCFGKLFFSY